MYRFKRFLALLLVVCLLSCSVFSIKVQASEVVIAGGITAATVFEICLFVGAVGVGCYAVGEVIDNREEIATFGKNLIDSISLDDVPDGWLFEFMDSDTGQEYVVGSEVIDYIQSCVWLGILGAVTGGGSDQEPDKEPDKEPEEDKKDWFKFDASSASMIASLTPLGATWLADCLSSLYQKWVNGEELTEAEHAVLAPVIEGYCDQNDIAKQWSGEPFFYSANFKASYTTESPKNHMVRNDTFTLDSSTPHCIVYTVDGSWRNFDIYMLDYMGELSSANMDCEMITYSNGSLTQHLFYKNRSSWTTASAYLADFTLSYSANFPVFSSRIEAEAYLKGTGAVTDALNYAKTYQNADWLSDDWAGVLIDPFTNIGLTLNQLVELAKALSLHAVGNNLSPQELADLIKQSLPAVNPDLLPDAVPVTPAVPAPDMDPIYYPYPGAHPLPGTTPGTKPDPDKDPDKEPGKEPEPDEDMSSYKVDLQAIFPFCIPFDFIALLRVLDAEPEAPRFDFPVVIPALDYHETVTFDMSIFDDVAEVIRLCETVSFIIFLMFSTSKVIKW